MTLMSKRAMATVAFDRGGAQAGTAYTSAGSTLRRTW